MKKTKRLGLLLTEREKAWVVNLAKIEGGLSQAALIRRLINKAGMEHGLYPDFRQDGVSAQITPNGGSIRGTGNLPHMEGENEKNDPVRVENQESQEVPI